MKNSRLFLVLLSISYSYGLYFHMGETEKKCFIEEIPDETMVTGGKDLAISQYFFPLSLFFGKAYKHK